MHKRHRCLFAQFRLGILPLYIETGRYDNTPVVNRICKQEEFHFLMQCSRYAEFREVLCNKSSHLIDNIFSYDNKKCVLQVVNIHIHMYLS